MRDYQTDIDLILQTIKAAIYIKFMKQKTSYDSSQRNGGSL